MDSNSERPGQFQHATPPQPASPDRTTGPAQVPHDTDVSQPTIRSRLATLNGAERFWVWKAGVRVFICVFDIIAIGCLGWLMSSALSLGHLYNDGHTFGGGVVGSIVTFCVSFIWCLIAIIVPFILKRTRPLHPGIAVGFDLCIWLAFIFIALVMLVGVFEAVYFGQDGRITVSDYAYNKGYSGEYYLAPNNTWIYNITYANNSPPRYYNYTSGQYVYPPFNTSTVVRDCTPQFISCQAQDEAVNIMWRGKTSRLATTIIVEAAAWLNTCLHFAVFVWACVDTHRHNAKKHKSKEQVMADRILANLETKGLISVIGGVAHPPRTGRPEMVESHAESSHARYA